MSYRSLFLFRESCITTVFWGYFQTGLVPRFPTLIFATFLLLAGLVSCSVALILDAMKKQSDREYELKLMADSEKYFKDSDKFYIK